MAKRVRAAGSGDDDAGGRRGRLEGVHRFLEDAFWPPYQPPAAAATNATPQDGGAAAPSSHKRGSSSSKKRASPAAALRRGRVVDLQLGEWCAAVRAKRPWVPSHRVHPFTAKVRAAFERSWHWAPVWAQVGVRSRAWRIGTRIDLVVRDTRTGHMFLVEIKTASAYGGAWAHDNGQRFLAPLEDVVSCPKNHALAQLTLTLALTLVDERRAAAQLRGLLKGAYVVVVDAHSVRRYVLPPWCLRLRDEVMARYGPGTGKVVHPRRVVDAPAKRARAE